MFLSLTVYANHRSQLVPLLLNSDVEALENMAVDVPLLRFLAIWVQVRKKVCSWKKC